jgi:hypothetical protein
MAQLPHDHVFEEGPMKDTDSELLVSSPRFRRADISRPVRFRYVI